MQAFKTLKMLKQHKDKLKQLQEDIDKALNKADNRSKEQTERVLELMKEYKIEKKKGYEGDQKREFKQWFRQATESENQIDRVIGWTDIFIIIEGNCHIVNPDEPPLSDAEVEMYRTLGNGLYFGES